LILVHNCFEEGSQDFESMIGEKSHHLFQLQRFKAFTSLSSASPLTVFITKYARYLEEKANVIKHHNCQFERNVEYFNGLSVSDAIKILPKLQSQFNSLCNCKITNAQKVSLIILRSYFLLLRDSVTIYNILNQTILRIYDNFSTLTKSEAANFINIYKLFVKETNAIIKIYDGARTLSGSLPTLEKVDESVITKLEQNVHKLSNVEKDGDSNVTNNVTEDLIGTKGLLFNTNSFAQNNENSGSDDNSSGEDPDQNIIDIFKPSTVTISNNPKTFNPFLDDIPPTTNFSVPTTPTNGNLINITSTYKSQQTSPSLDPFASLFTQTPTQTPTSTTVPHNPFNNNETYNPFITNNTNINNQPKKDSSNPFLT